MTPSILTRGIEAANAAGRIALIPFITAGFPAPGKFRGILRDLDESGADIIEVGVPFSDPVADGPVVEEASRRALSAGIGLRGILEELAEDKDRRRAPLVLMGYYNPFLQYGLSRFARDAAEAGVSGCIVPDLPLDEDAPMRAALGETGSALIPLIGVNTGLERMRAYAGVAAGYVYLVSVLGVTGERAAFSAELAAAFTRAQSVFSLPLAVGFGFSRPEQLDAVPFRPQAVVFGSSLLRFLDEGGSAADFMKRWKGR
ncbi:MAG: tryptophan synthase subunit alpha [Desulfovibrio sp.]|jgi:tryptophan synthase alpha chain|nr:tryptophan synthase subunit alpha [Desulfovibrio sp.]